LNTIVFLSCLDPDYHMEVTDPATSVNPSIEFISQVWNETLSKTNFDAFNRKGYLSYQLEEKLHVLSLNTVPYSVCMLLIT
jgi:sphingomyelin phosphodiesterase acid-like 3